MSIPHLTTPCLLIEQGRLRRNLARMQETADANDVALRPHVKTHKSVALAERQRERGAAGLTVATVEEAAAFVEAGAEDVRVAYPVTGRDKHEQLAALRDRARLSCTVDTAAGAEQAAAVHSVHDRPLDVLMEVDVGHGRCGVPWTDATAATRLARRIVDLPGLRLAGLAEAGVPGVAPDDFEISVGSTPSMAAFENAEHAGFRITEIRPGNYVVHDAMQVGLGAASLADCALTVLTTVVSVKERPDGPDRAFVDAGKKVFTTDTGYGTHGHGVVLRSAEPMIPHPDLRVVRLSEEHGWLEGAGAAALTVGERLRIVPNHACVCIATQNTLYVVEGDDVVDTWTVAPRG